MYVLASRDRRYLEGNEISEHILFTFYLFIYMIIIMLILA